VQLDGAAAGVRARDLDRSGRREVAGLLRRTGVRLSGIDLWIPASHFVESARVERAVDAATGAIELAADLAKLAGDPGGAIVAVTLPEGGEAVAQLARAAELRGVRLADHTLPDAGRKRPPSAEPSFGIGIDPAALLLRGLDPARAVLDAGGRLVQARLSDGNEVGRVAPGSGRLDAAGYLGALAGAGHSRPVVLDLRGLPDQDAAAQAAASFWRGS
jgi:sugar phosphate isomerase/epimerase